MFQQFRYQRYWPMAGSSVRHLERGRSATIRREGESVGSTGSCAWIRVARPTRCVSFQVSTEHGLDGARCSALCFGLVIVALIAFDPGHDSRAIELLLVVGLGLFGALTLRSFGHLRDSVAANSDGIW